MRSILEKIRNIFTGEHRRFAWFVVIATTVFIISWTVGSGNTIVHWIRTVQKIERQEEQMEFYRNEIEEMDRNIDELRNNKDTLEKFARERFKFAAPGEDVYIIE